MSYICADSHQCRAHLCFISIAMFSFRFYSPGIAFVMSHKLSLSLDVYLFLRIDRLIRSEVRRVSWLALPLLVASQWMNVNRSQRVSCEHVFFKHASNYAILCEFRRSILLLSEWFNQSCGFGGDVRMARGPAADEQCIHQKWKMRMLLISRWKSA